MEHLLSNPIKDLSVYKQSEISSDKMIVRVEHGSYHEVNAIDLTDYIDESKSTLGTIFHLHEVIHPDRIQRIRFDLDNKRPSEIDVWPLVDIIIKTTIEFYREVAIYECAHDDINEEDFLITTSGSSLKQSYHIMTPIYCENTYLCAHYFDAIVARIQSPLMEANDAGINKAWQNFRLPYSSKLDDPKRIKRPLDSSKTVFDHLIGWYSMPDKPKILLYDTKKLAESVNNFVTMSHSSVGHATVLDMVKSAIPDFDSTWQFRQNNGPFYAFKRLRPSHCAICNRTHNNDNTLYVVIGSSNTKPVYMRCHHASKDARGILLGHLDQNAIVGQRITEIVEATSNREPVVVSGVPDIVLPMEFTTLTIKAPMKMGKTNAVIDLMQKMKPKSIIYVSFRITFTTALLQTLNSKLGSSHLKFISYQDIEGEINIDRYPYIIIQVDSLSRLKITNPPELLILDETESIWSQFSSNLIRSPDWVFSKFHWLIRMSSKLICMDAHLNERTFRLLNKWRPAEITRYENPYQNATSDVYNVVQNTDAIIQIACEKLNGGKKIVICSNSLEEAKTIETALGLQFQLYSLNRNKTSGIPVTGKVIVSYNSETSPTIKNLHFSDVNSWWSKVDILIYTPTVTAGISFEVAHFDCIFGYFTNLSCDVETTIQMLGRVRSVKDKTYYICFKEIPTCLPTNINLIAHLMTSCYRDSHVLCGSKDPPPGSPLFTDDGQIIYQKSPFFELWIENLAFQNASKNGFVQRFVDLVSRTGAKFVNHAVIIGEGAFTHSLKAVRQIAHEDHAKKISSSRDLTNQEYESLQSLIRGGAKDIVVTEDDMDAIHKKALSLHYKRDRIDPDFVLTFDNGSMKMTFRNLLKVFRCIRAPFNTNPAPYKEIIRIIQEKELLSRSHAIKAFNSTLDVTIDFDYLRHLYALNILDSLGFKEIDQSTRIRPETFDENYAKLTVGINPHLDKIASIYELRRPTDDLIPFLRKVLRQQYNIGIYKKHGIWCLEIEKNILIEIERVVRDGRI